MNTMNDLTVQIAGFENAIGADGCPSKYVRVRNASSDDILNYLELHYPAWSCAIYSDWEEDSVIAEIGTSWSLDLQMLKEQCYFGFD